MPKSWAEKLNSKSEPKVEVIDNPMMGLPAGQRLYISHPKIVDQYIRAIPRGQTRLMMQMRQDLAAQNEADVTCPLTAGIFTRIVAEASLEEMRAGKISVSDMAPFWRLIDEKSPLAKKVSCGPEFIREMREIDAKK